MAKPVYSTNIGRPWQGVKPDSRRKNNTNKKK